MALRTNSAEGGTNGVNATAANSGGSSGTAFTAGNKNAGGTVTYDNAQKAHGSLSYHVIATGSTADYAYFVWSGMTVSAGGAGRVYFRLVSLPSAAQDLLQIRNASGVAGKLAISAANKLIVQNAAGSTLQTFATTLAINTWYRAEIYVVPGTTTSNGTIKAAYYLLDTAVGSPVDATYNSSAVNSGTTALTTMQFGKLATIGTLEAFFDDAAFDDAATDIIGPYVTPTNPTAAFTSTSAALAVTFDASTSAPHGGGVTIASYAWTFGDTGTGTGVGPTHTYSLAGTYSVNLVVTDSNGLTDNVTHSVTVFAAGASASVIAVTSAPGYTAINAPDIATAESDADPTTWAQSPANPTGQPIRLRLGPLVTAAVGTGVTVQHEVDATGATSASEVARLFEGSTLRATAPSQSIAFAGAGTPMVNSLIFTFDAASIANVTSFLALDIEFAPTASS